MAVDGPARRSFIARLLPTELIPAAASLLQLSFQISLLIGPMAAGLSPLHFHRRFSEELENKRITYVHHKVMAVTTDIQALYATEELLVGGHWHDERRLNMIPGGKAGLRYLRQNGMLSKHTVPQPDERDQFLLRWMRDNPRKGVPAPWISEKWKDDAWATAQICGRQGRLSVQQIAAVRRLAYNYDVEDIAERIGAMNASQVQRVIEGKTYSRVKT